MKIYLLLLLLCLFNASFGQVERNYAQDLYHLLEGGRYFEAKEFKSNHQNQFKPYEQVVELVYNMHMSQAFNKPDSSIIYFEEFLGNPYYVRNIGPAVGQFYVRLCETYESKQYFEKAISTVQRHINYLNENPYSLPAELIKKEVEDAQRKISSLDIKLRDERKRGARRLSKDTKIELKDNAHIRFDARYNGHVVETFFDTGVTEFCMMEKELADELGVKYNAHQSSQNTLNGKPVNGIEGYIDSIEIGGITLFNIPVVALIDKFAANLGSNINHDLRQTLEHDLLKSRQVLFGLPTMKMLGRFEFDWKSNTLVIPRLKESIVRSSDANMMLYGKALYIHMDVNDTDYIGHLDLGADLYLYLTYPFFFKSNSVYIKNDPQKRPYIGTGFLGVQENVERQRLDKPRIYVDGRSIDSSKPQREVYAVEGINTFDGLVGVKFFKNSFSKTVVDFSTMTIECED
ncbi:retropepsin-like aspartic protease [Sphingobacterium bambusae]|uniref:Aspartyl protease family protein n=1 Tax=Sphingobacterium bambusae TaxID=662858 RepID=A0ABW6BG73_9SPHI|nr:retropepsin-like aspartic protease [Sphingobacterium bambusae]WPL47463.1 retropepsin-like aspartic protease [Sphingobacterium bambusae]